MTTIGSSRVVRYLLAIYIMSAILISYLPGGSNISQGIGIILAFVFVIQLFAKRDGLSLPQELFVFILFFAYSLLGGFSARNVSTFVQSEFTLFQLVIFAVIAYKILSTRLGIALAVKAFVFGVLISTGFAMAGIDFSSSSRVGSLLVNPNLYGLSLLFGVIFGVYLLLISVSKRWKLFYFLLLPLFSYQIFCTGSRKAALGLMAFPVIFFLLYASRRFVHRPVRVVVIAVILVGVLISLLGFLQSSPFYRRMQNLQQVLILRSTKTVGEGSIQERAAFYQAAFRTWQDHSLLGVGTNQFRFYASDYIPGLRVTYSHSNFMEILADFGLIGFLLYYSIYALIFRNLFRLWRMRLTRRDALIRDILISFITIFVVSELAWVTYSEKLVWIVLSVVIALSHGLIRKYRKGLSYVV